MGRGASYNIRSVPLFLDRAAVGHNIWFASPFSSVGGGRLYAKKMTLQLAKANGNVAFMGACNAAFCRRALPGVRRHRAWTGSGFSESDAVESPQSRIPLPRWRAFRYSLKRFPH